jgi:pimeloyl-ACP methyl ester carboxylesterase
MSDIKNLLFLLVSGLLLSCHEAVESNVPVDQLPEEKRYFVSATAGQETSMEILQLLASGFDQGHIAALLKHDVKTYTLTYLTSYKGEPVEASGLIMLPKDLTAEAAIISLQHGTTFIKNEAPSVDGGFQGAEFFASAGYITIMPDFIGYGKTASIFHPYYDSQHAASTVIDMIKATREFLQMEKILFSEKLFLAGYSEGGFVTLAAAKEIENNSSHDLAVSAVAAGAGGYDLPEMLKGITTGDYYAYPAYLAFVLMSYNETYEWNKPLSYFFKAEYAEALSKYMNGLYGGGTINSRLTTHTPSLFNPDFFARLKTIEGEPELKNALRDNSVAGWKTNIPIRLFHGTKDEIIPYQNSEIALDKFKAAGSAAEVSLKLISGGTHGNSFGPMLQDFIPWFLSFK